MSEEFDFERYWLAKLSGCLDEVAGEEVRHEVMAGSEGLTMESGRQEVIAWSREAMARLDSLVEEQDRKQIMLGCACQYPKADLQDLREQYAAGDDSLEDIFFRTVAESS